MGFRASSTGKQAQQLRNIWNSFDFQERKDLAKCSTWLDFKKIAFKQWVNLSTREKQELIKCAIIIGLVSIK